MKNETEKSDVARREEEMLAFWKEHDVFNATLTKDSPKGDFVFYDGPPFATGLPHYGHILASTIKDAIPRFFSMNGYRVKRIWGWDCHGLPLENIIEKRLGLATKRDIEALGVKKFNEAARDAVLEYADDWKRIIPRMGRFVDMEHDYKTMNPSYTESVWWVFSELNKKGLVYEGFKSMHLCPRCGTTLSNFEVNQGYKDIKDIAVTVRLRLHPGQKIGDFVTDECTSLLVWTTTPWTLPGNMAAAVHNEIEYVKVKMMNEESGEEFLVLARERLAQLGTDAYEVVAELKGSDLVGKSYEPPFAYFKHQEFAGKEKAWKIYHADYVEIGEEGTGAVHIAPAYGEEDMDLAKKEGVPIMHHVDHDGHFMSFVTDFAGKLVKPKDDEESGVDHKDADIEILKALQKVGKIFKKENITHSYPHCWRCDTPLLNYATTSWFVRVTDIKDQLVAENAKVTWVPDHVGTNRFGKWLEGARDWAISRQRYWGAPLPIWKNEKTKECKVLGSLEDLKAYVSKSGNKYFKMRHGEADHNLSQILSTRVENEHHLTEKGKEQVRIAAESLRDAHIDYLYVSPLIRTQETAAIVAEVLGISKEHIITDDRLRENAGGIFEGKSIEEWYNYRNALTDAEKVTDAYEGGESWLDIRKRMLSVLFEVENKYAGKNILFISHGMPLRLMKWGAELVPTESMVRSWETEGDIPTGSVHAINFVPFPHNDNYELDYHRPYIDAIELVDTDGSKLVRVPDVFDCWFESGSMPYAQHHYPFENEKRFEGACFPAQFIAEGLDQTRGWFYSLIVLGTALFGKSPYENVIVNGLVLAEDGKKMSKKLSNYPDPMELADRVGVDAMRYYLLSSPVVKGEDLRFSEKEVLELQRKNIGRLHNVLQMYEQYADPHVHAGTTSAHVLDRWMIARIAETVRESTQGYTTYELDRAVRPLEGLIDDVSVWYLRRSRERLKGVDDADKGACLATLRYTLRNLALLMAPAMPFYAEYLFLRVREDGDAESVHLMDWPETADADMELLAIMSIIRSYATIGLKLRSEKNIKVRQPLQVFWIKHSLGTPKYWNECAPILADELNVKEVLLKSDAEQTNPAADFDWEVTPELKREGDVRELIRAIQDARKQLSLKPSDRIVLVVDARTHDCIGTLETEMLRVVGAREIRIGEGNREVVIDDVHYTFDIVS